MVQVGKEPTVAFAAEHHAEARVHLHEQRLGLAGFLAHPQRAEHDAATLVERTGLVVVVEYLEGYVLGLFLVALEAGHERRKAGVHLVLARADEREIALEERVEDEMDALFGGLKR